jgi:hypothetical protein
MNGSPERGGGTEAQVVVFKEGHALCGGELHLNNIREILEFSLSAKFRPVGKNVFHKFCG